MSDADVAAVRARLSAMLEHDAVAALDQQQREIVDAKAEVEHWVMRHNELEQWRIQTRQRADKAEADLAAAKAAQAQLQDRLNRAAPHACPTCGPNVKVDEDLCCAACGADTVLIAIKEQP